ncbi:MAG: PKD domain-containing protein, partial [Candidatus Schekmanbacteria bacterium]|nr:PKD domain-containing protein [Candidatus Schekmanbacteria bacterium]
TSSGQGTGQRLAIRLGGLGAHTIDCVRLLGGNYRGALAVTVEVSATGGEEDGAWQTVTSGVAPLDQAFHELAFAPVTAQYVRLLLSNTTAGPDVEVVWGERWQPQSFVSDPGSADRDSLVCEWDFGDGRRERIAACADFDHRLWHAYAAPGTYAATLTVSDKDGEVSADALEVRVSKTETFIDVRATRRQTPGAVAAVATLLNRFDWSPVAGKEVELRYGSQAARAADVFLELYPPGSNPQGAAKGEANALKDALDADVNGRVIRRG